MNRIVLDASAALAWCFREEAQDYPAILRQHLGSAQAVVPGIWPLEIANSIAAALRRKKIEPAEVTRFLAIIEELGVLIDPLTAEKALKETLAIATERDLTAYDAAYLELAMREGAQLATLDGDLRRAATEAGVRVI